MLATGMSCVRGWMKGSCTLLPCTRDMAYSSSEKALSHGWRSRLRGSSEGSYFLRSGLASNALRGFFCFSKSEQG